MSEAVIKYFMFAILCNEALSAQLNENWCIRQKIIFLMHGG